MTRLSTALLSLCLCLAGFAPASFAQSGAIPGLDVSLGDLGPIDDRGRIGTFPNGRIGASMETTACNVGSVTVPWMDGDDTNPMNDDHPWIAFIVAREDPDRFLQISDYSYIKAGFGVFAQNVCGTCTSCGPFGICDFLAPGCSDTYTLGINDNPYFLAAPDELDPWLVTWDPFGTQFDRGEPPVAPPDDTDGIRSLTPSMANNLDPVTHRIEIDDAELDVSGSTFWYQGAYMVMNEEDAARDNNMSSRRFVPSWTGADWDLQQMGAGLPGTILQRWSGSSLSSGTNGPDDGRVYVAVKVTGPTEGLYHYEYALHNRDNSRGISALRIPICSGARVLNAGFHDVDDDAGNEWTLVVNPTEAVFSTSSNALRWNAIYNFWFDSDAAPDTSGLVTLDQLDPGAGMPSFAVGTTVPGVLHNVYLGDGCAFGAPPTLFATGSPPQALLGNGTYAVVSNGNVPGAANLLFYSLIDGSFPLGAGCTVFLGGAFGAGIVLQGTGVSNGAGSVTYPLPVPNDASLEGAHVNLQTAGVNPGGGPVFSVFELSNGLRSRVGNSITDCP